VTVPAPSSADDAVAMMLAGLGWLAKADLTSVPTAAQADTLRALERASSMHAAARAAALAAFTTQVGYEDDGHGSPRTWLTWQTRITRPAASAAIASMRRLRAHHAVANALASGDLSESWARQICEWTDRLPEDARLDADTILLTAAGSGANLADLAALAEQIRRRVAGPDRDRDNFDERSLRLATTFEGAGTLRGDLTPRCAGALQAVLDALGKRVGPEDTRSRDQRHHDALEEALRRLIASGCLPDRAGQSTQIQLHLTLDDLIRGAGGQPGSAGAPWPGPAAGPGDDCDAVIAPVVTGQVDHELLGKLASTVGAAPRPDHASDRGQAAARELILAHAVALLSGPGSLTSLLRTGRLGGPAASASLPLDVGAVTETIPPHLRRAVITRDQHCAAPGCDQAPAGCQVHHIIPRSEGGPTALGNLLLLCSFHHLILIHRWGWTIALNSDGTTTATSPDKSRTYRSHGPPAAAA